MYCPYCNHTDSRVTGSRVVEAAVRRRRECEECGLRFTTYERAQTTALWIGKQDGRREEFNRDKLVSGITKACAKRPILTKDIEKIVEDVESELQSLGRSEIPSNVIGGMVTERLKTLDRVAYVRFASVYRDFQHVESFTKVVEDLREDTDAEQLPLIDGLPPENKRPIRRKRITKNKNTGMTAKDGEIDA